MAASFSSSVPETVFEGFEFSEANNILLMALMEEETDEDDQVHDRYYADDRLMSMIQSLEAEISSSNSADPHQRYDEMRQVEGQDCSTSSISVSTNDWVDMEVTSACSSSSSSSSLSSVDEDIIMSAWSPCAASGDDSGDYSEYYYGVLLENYLPHEAGDVVF